MNVFINGSGIISAQRTFDGSAWLNGFSSLSENRNKAAEPDYSNFIDARQIRRMSRIIRMGIVSAILASRESGITKFDAILTGTAFGCLEDTNSFLSKMVEHREEMLSPTAFIHSTHNTISSQIALWFQCRGYNSTYVHRAQSFESALLDSMLLFEEGSSENILAGGVDEITDASFTIMDRLGYFRNKKHPGKGSSGSEGSAFFALSPVASASSYARITGVEMFSFTDNEETAQKIQDFLREKNIHAPDMIFAGYNGDGNNDSVYDLILDMLPYRNPVIKYKQWCGEYATASGFGMWLAAMILKNKKIPVPLLNLLPATANLNSILLYHHTDGRHHSLILLQSC